MLACGHDTGYAPFLGQFAGNKQVAERITLLEGSPFPPVIRDLGFKRTQFTSVFNSVTQSTVSACLVGPAGGRSVMSTMAETLTDRGNKLGSPKTLGQGGPVVPAVSGTPMGYRNPRSQSDRLAPVLTDQNGRRVDRSLKINMSVVERIKKGLLCYHFFLRGECVLPTCRRNHAHRPLTDEEFDALWVLARQGQCYKSQKADRNAGDDCSDAMCVYGHRSGNI